MLPWWVNVGAVYPIFAELLQPCLKPYLQVQFSIPETLVRGNIGLDIPAASCGDDEDTHKREYPLD